MTKAREPAPTVAFIDDYCAHYQTVFPNVRQFEQFTRLELGLVAETKRKSLPRLAQATKADPQACHHFLAKADWSVEEVHATRLELTRQALRERLFILCIDETGDRKKGKTTYYAAHQYIGNVHTLANGVVSVNAYGRHVACSTPSPFRSPSGSTSRNRASSRATSTRASPSWPSSSLRSSSRRAFTAAWCLPTVYMERVGTSRMLCHALHRLDLQYVVAIRSNHGVWTFPGERVRQTRWRLFLRVFTDGSAEQRSSCEFVFGKRGGTRYFVVTTDPVHLPPETTWHLMTK